MNSMWRQKYSRSHDFLSNCIAHNPSVGLFNKDTGELVAWTLMLETGASGSLVVLEKFRRKGFGESVTAELFRKMRKVIGKDITGHVGHQNMPSLELVKRFKGKQWIDNNSWIGIRPQQPLKIVPLWGHL